MQTVRQLLHRAFAIREQAHCPVARAARLDLGESFAQVTRLDLGAGLEMSLGDDVRRCVTPRLSVQDKSPATGAAAWNADLGEDGHSIPQVEVEVGVGSTSCRTWGPGRAFPG